MTTFEQSAISPRRNTLVAGGMAALCCLFFVSLAIGSLGAKSKVFISDFGLVAAASVAAVLCATAAARHGGRARAGWGLMSAASLMWATGEALWTYFELGTSGAPFPSLADIAYLAAVPLAVAGMLAFQAGRSMGTSKLRTILDGMAIAGSVFLIGWMTVLAPLVRAGEESRIALAIGLAYPAGDIVILTAVFWLLARSSRENRAPMVILGLALAALAVADSGFTYLTLSNDYASGSLIDAAWFGG